MFRSVFGKTAFHALGAGMVLLLAASHGAQAHVVTDDEAGRLTLDALTAVPAPVRHVTYRHAVHMMSVSDRHAVHATVRSRGLVHNVVYHPRVATAARHVSKAHRRT
ncbi:hypothetical protein AA12717_3906 [Gluconacetobacter sacchari DSM 12717]|uniref:Uncharacterized protein n=2 Tax=Gluconacetobacter sacchari TaxID=92759 RepID=A0A7W4NQI4_9PROT|nr:hypothetical protein [Gluconacetobacter sacchari]MBB2159150.1 hypothetical protein [Gluconacetobacter sacchari]GBQ31897.1 hypothetical protein AA12717_3906 [Gluconacetobacter sacchari DSM 12717]